MSEELNTIFRLSGFTQPNWVASVSSYDHQTDGATEKDIIPEPIKPGDVHPELSGQIDAQRKSTMHGVIEERPRRRDQILVMMLRIHIRMH